MAEITQQDFIASEEIVKEIHKINEALLGVVKTGKEIGTSIKGADSIRAVKDETTKLTASQSELQKIEKQIATVQAKNNEEYLKQKRSLADLNTQLKQKTALGDRDARTINSTNASLKELNAALQKNKDAYKSLANEEARASKEGQELKAIIDQQDASVKKLNGGLGDFRDNVGDYEGSFKRAGSAFQQIAPGAHSAAAGMFQMVKAAVAFIATPIGLVIAALGAAIFALTSYFKGSEEGQNRLNKITAVGSAIFEQFMNVVEAIGEAIYNAFTDPVQAIKDFGNFLVTNIVNRFVGMFELIPQLGKAIGLLFKGNFKEAGQVAFDAVAKVTTGIEDATQKLGNFIDETGKLVEAGIAFGNKIANVQAEIDRKERKLIVDRAKTNLEVAKLREQAITLEGAAKRKAIEEAIALETRLSNEEVKFATLKLRLAELNRDANGDDKAALLEVANAQAAVTDAEALRYNNTVKFRKQLEALDDEDAKKKAEQFKAIDKNAAAAGKTISDTFKKPVPVTLFDSISTGIGKAVDSARFKLDEFKTKALGIIANIQDAFNKYAVTTAEFFKATSDLRIAKLDEEKNALEVKHAREIELAGDNEAAKTAIDKRYEASKARIDKKIIEEKQKQARIDKALAIFQIAINTAKNIIEVFPNPYLIALAIATGAIQAATVAAKPIPKFFRGTKSAPGGSAMVGEQGVELMRKPGDDWELTPSMATVMDIPKGTEIIPHKETLQRLAQGALSQNGGMQYVDNSNKEVVSEIRNLNTNLKKLKPIRQNLVRSGSTVYHAIEAGKKQVKILRGINLGRWL